MARRLVVLALCAVVFAVISGCGDVNSPAGSDSSISDADVSVLNDGRQYTKDWNRVAEKWALLIQDPAKTQAEFEKRSRRYLRTLNKDVLGIQVMASTLDGRSLRDMMLRISALYRRQFELMTDATSDLLKGNESKANRTLDRLRRVAQRKTRLASQLIERYPKIAAGSLE